MRSLLRFSVSAALALGLGLTVPSWAGTNHESLRSQQSGSSAQGADLFDRAWAWVRGLWAQDGSGVDAGGKTGKGPSVSPEGGCVIDPNGNPGCVPGSSGQVVSPH
jgi:hypothetical protein